MDPAKVRVGRTYTRLGWDSAILNVSIHVVVKFGLVGWLVGRCKEGNKSLNFSPELPSHRGVSQEQPRELSFFVYVDK